MRPTFKALLTGAATWTGAIGLSWGITAISPEKAAAWGAVLGIPPVAVILGSAIWLLLWRMHAQNLAAIRDNSASIRELTVALIRRTVPNGNDTPPRV